MAIYDDTDNTDGTDNLLCITFTESSLPGVVKSLQFWAHAQWALRQPWYNCEGANIESMCICDKGSSAGHLFG